MFGNSFTLMKFNRNNLNQYQIMKKRSIYSSPTSNVADLHTQSFFCISGDTTEQYLEGPVYDENEVYGEE